jgi:hypothetical protein
MTMVDVLALLIQVTAHAQTLAQIIQKARSEGRDELTAEEIQTVRNMALDSDARLVEALSR